MTIQSMIEAIEAEVDDWCVGPSKAFFTLPHGRVAYTTYAFIADTCDEALTALKHVVLHAIRASEGEADFIARYYGNHGAFLFWRLRDKVQAEERPDGRWVARTRLAIVKTVQAG